MFLNERGVIDDSLQSQSKLVSQPIPFGQSSEPIEYELKTILSAIMSKFL